MWLWTSFGLTGFWCCLYGISVTCLYFVDICTLCINGFSLICGSKYSIFFCQEHNWTTSRLSCYRFISSEYSKLWICDNVWYWAFKYDPYFNQINHINHIDHIKYDLYTSITSAPATFKPIVLTWFGNNYRQLWCTIVTNAQ